MLFLSELLLTYNDKLNRKKINYQTYTNTYKDFIIEQLAIKADKEIYKYWQKELYEYSRLDFLPAEATGNVENHNPGSLKSFQLDDSLKQSLLFCSKHYGTGIKNIYFAAFILESMVISGWTE